MIIFVFFRRPQNTSVFGKTLQTRLDCEYVNAKKIVNFFKYFEICFWVEGAYALGSRIKFSSDVMAPGSICFLYFQIHI
jgi:hypothetical protein